MNLPTSDAIRPALPAPTPRWAFLLLILATTLTAIPGQAATHYSRVVLFGDSLSDTGNLLRRSNGRLPADPPYWKGRFSNGPVWIEYLVRDTGSRLTNRAFGSALSGYGNLGGSYPGLRSQVDAYLRGRSGRADSEALYILWAGARIRVPTAGVHTLNLWMREDGLSVDRILLTPSRAYRPQGFGPPESKRE